MDKFNARFIYPVIVDGTAPNDLTSKEFSRFNYTLAPGGEATPEFIQLLKERVRERRLKAASQ